MHGRRRDLAEPDTGGGVPRHRALAVALRDLALEITVGVVVQRLSEDTDQAPRRRQLLARRPRVEARLWRAEAEVVVGTGALRQMSLHDQVVLLPRGEERPVTIIGAIEVGTLLAIHDDQAPREVGGDRIRRQKTKKSRNWRPVTSHLFTY